HPPTPPAAAAHLPRDVPHVRTGGAGEAVAARPFLGHQHVTARRAEKQHRRIASSGGMAEAEEELAHADVLELFQAALARLVQDPLLCDLPPQVTPEEIGSQVALEYGQAMTVRVCKADGESM
ncbi:LOW QUALITY PROTEIN: U11/U12 small nuclear ribonucleoprotein 25 kDa protein, partial [Meleagris gallopavo]|uniref:LOW QUALITY PROTEIN: U11/U12 small nuclear ribonucleoprotein 25 kDa protein n=1 Tax=Meleagris gallopavo TaxID=9103 RepID=UPI00093BB029